MSYAESVRGALALVSGVSRRVQALRELGLGKQDEQAILGWLDSATDSLISVVQVLEQNGKSATGSKQIAASAGNDKTWRESVYGGAKEPGTTTRVMGTTPAPERPKWESVKDKRKRLEAEAKAKPSTAVPPVSTPEVDLAHPWRSGEERT